MISTSTYKNIACCLALLGCMPAAAQEVTRVKASVDRSQILIGEPIQLKLEANIPANQPIRFFQIDSLQHFELLSRDRIDTVDNGGATVLSQIIKITSFDSGHWVIPPLPFGNELLTDSIPVDIGFAPFDPQQPYHDVKDIIDVKQPEEKKKPWLLWIVSGIIVLLAAVYLLTRKKKPAPQVVQPPADPYKMALEQLEILRKEKPAAKIYYTRLIDIFRVYVHKRKDVHSLQQTTDDLVVRLSGIGMHGEIFNQLSQVLKLGDFVKFAKYEPTGQDDGHAFETMKKSIQHIEQLP